MKDVDLSPFGFDVDKEIARVVKEAQEGREGRQDGDTYGVEFLGLTFPVRYSPSTTRRGEVSFTHEAFFTLVALVFGYAASTGMRYVMDSKEFAAVRDESFASAEMIYRLSSAIMEHLGNPEGIENYDQLCEALLKKG